MKRDPRTMPTRGRTLDHAAAVYDCLSPLMLLGSANRLDRMVLDALELEGDDRVLDIGCGTGSLTKQIGRRISPENGGAVIGIDAAARMIDVAQKRANCPANVTFQLAMAESLPFPDESFDRIVTSLFLHHVDRAAKLAAVNEMARTLKPGGKAIILDVDVPTTLLGKISAWSGYILFQQPEIRENIEGVLRDVISESHFSSYHQLSHHSGYLTLFELTP